MKKILLLLILNIQIFSSINAQKKEAGDYESKKIDLIEKKEVKGLRALTNKAGITIPIEDFILKTFKRENFFYTFSLIGNNLSGKKYKSKIRVQKFDLYFKKVNEIDLKISKDYLFQKMYELENGIALEVLEKDEILSKYTLNLFDLEEFKLKEEKKILLTNIKKELETYHNGLAYFPLKGHSLFVNVSNNRKYLAVTSMITNKAFVYNSSLELEYKKEFNINELEIDSKTNLFSRHSVSDLGEIHFFCHSPKNKKKHGSTNFIIINQLEISSVNLNLNNVAANSWTQFGLFIQNDYMMPEMNFLQSVYDNGTSGISFINNGFNYYHMQVLDRNNRFIIANLINNELTIMELSKNKKSFNKKTINLETILSENSLRLKKIFLDKLTSNFIVEVENGYNSRYNGVYSFHRTSINILKFNSDLEIVWTSKINKKQDGVSKDIYNCSYNSFVSQGGNLCYVYNSNKKNHPGLLSKRGKLDRTIVLVTVNVKNGKIIQETIIDDQDSFNYKWKTMEFISFGDSFILGGKMSFLYFY